MIGIGRDPSLGIRKLMLLAAVMTAVFVAACNDEDDDGGGVGPCYHEYRDAVVHISAVTDFATGAALDTLYISSATVRGSPHPLTWLPEEPNSEGLQAVGDSLRCLVPCSFGQQEGQWSLTVSAPGYPRQVVEFAADYAVFHGGCPSWNDEGTDVALRLVVTGAARLSDGP